MQNQGMQAEAKREPTLNERLNKVSDSLQIHCERIEGMLSRVNGTPRAESRVTVTEPTPINPISLAVIVDHLEAVQSRLRDLSINLERIA